MPDNTHRGDAPTLELLNKIRVLEREVRGLKRMLGALNRRLLRLEKGKPDAD